jgi:hypothetical protein
MLADGEQRRLFYQPVVFSVVGEWLACVTEHCGEDALLLQERAALISPILRDYLEQVDFKGAWENLQKNSRGSAALMQAFHGWFDAFRTMRLIHELSDWVYPRIPTEEALLPLLEHGGIVCSDTSICGQLEFLRTLQRATGHG